MPSPGRTAIRCTRGGFFSRAGPVRGAFAPFAGASFAAAGTFSVVVPTFAATLAMGASAGRGRAVGGARESHPPQRPKTGRGRVLEGLADRRREVRRQVRLREHP